VKDWLPTLSVQLETLAKTPAVEAINHSVWLFSVIQLGHLLSIAVLGGAVLVLNLRVLGFAMPGLTAPDVERSTRPWLIASVLGTVLTGLLMTLATTQSSLTSTAFLIKMIALLAAILLSISVAAQVNRERSRIRRLPQALAAVAAAMWIVAVWLFASAANLGAGVVLVAIAGFALLAAFIRARRKVYLAGIATILIVGLGGTFLVPPTEAGDVLAVQLSVGTVLLGGVFAILMWAGESRRGKLLTVPLDRASALVATLAWVTVAVAGRWIGFS
jgi:drug/metabolite transporter (DMT)-like permease